MKLSFHRLLLPLLLLLVPVLFADAPEMPERVQVASEPIQPKRGPVAPGKSLSPGVQVQLSAPDLVQVRAEDALARVQAGQSKGPSRVGIRRPLGQSVRVAGDKTSWNLVENGERIWTARLSSDGAHSIRVRFEEVQLPPGVELVVFKTADPSQFEGPFDAGYLSGRTTFWSSSVFASDVTVECRVPAGVDAPSFRITELTHRYVVFGAEGKIEDEAKAAGACNINLACEPAWTETSKAVAGIGTVSTSGEIFCTGCLLNDSNPTAGTDYFLTANHCITGQSDADSTEFYWNYQATTCGGTPPNPASVPRTTGGASILSARSLESLNDHCFLRLRGTVPAGVTYAGWSSTAPGASEVITGIHHPDGDYKRISFGLASALDANYWRVRWTRGVTEPGSSGSPIFGADHKLIGQLYGGSSACENTDPALQVDQYGRFDVTFPLIRRWLLNEPLNPPANDNFASALVITGPEGTAAPVNTLDATRETGEPDHANAGGRSSVWYRWTAPSSTNFTFETVGSSFDTVLAVYTGTFSNLKLIAANNDSEVGVGSSRVGIAAVAGRVYFIAADGFDGESGSLNLSWHPGGEITAPPNDLFANASPVVGFGGIYHANNRGYTRETGEPVHASVNGARSAWWTWTAPISSIVNVNTLGSSFDTLLAVYTGTGVNALLLVASNDDINTAGQVFESSVNFNAVAGRTYRIAVDGYSGTVQAEGEIRLEVAQGGGTPGANNAFASAVTLGGASGEILGNNRGFTRETGEPNHDGIAGQRSAWWTWTAPSSGSYVFDTLGSGFDTVLAVYTGAAVNALSAVASNDDIVLGDVWQSRVTFNATAGQTYRIAVDGFFETGTTQEEGNIRLAWRASNSVVPRGDLTVAGDLLNPRVESRTFGAGDCEVVSGCATLGNRRILVFDLEIRNVGAASINLGQPSTAGGFVTNVCRTGLELPGFVVLRLLSTNGTLISTRQTSLCLSDSVHRTLLSGPASAQFTCENQGLSTGWAATAAAGAACRWLDVTELAAGAYLLEVEVDPSGRIPESSETNNVVRIPVQVTTPVVVPNDAFASATPVSGAMGTVAGSNMGATLESGEPVSTGRSTVWYTWTSPCNGRAVFDTLGSDFDTYLGAFAGSGLGSLSLLAEGDDIGEIVQSEVRFVVVRGGTYHLRVDGFDPTESGNIHLNWRLEGSSGCSGAPVLSGGWLSNGGFEVRFTSLAGTQYALEATEDLTRVPLQWTRLGTLAGNGLPQSLVDTTASQSSTRARYYRVVTVP